MERRNERFSGLEPMVFTDPRNGATLRVWPPRATPVRPSGRTHSVIEGDRLDSLSQRALGSAERWWVLADGSEELDPSRMLVPGRRIQIPGGS